MGKYKDLPVICKLNGQVIDPMEFAKLYTEKINQLRREGSKDGKRYKSDKAQQSA